MGLEPVADKGGGSHSFWSHLFDLTNLLHALKQSAKPEASAVSGPLLDPQVYCSQRASPQDPVVLNDWPITAHDRSVRAC